MRTCHKCGTILEEGALFCEECGAKNERSPERRGTKSKTSRKGLPIGMIALAAMLVVIVITATFACIKMAKNNARDNESERSEEKETSESVSDNSELSEVLSIDSETSGGEDSAVSKEETEEKNAGEHMLYVKDGELFFRLLDSEESVQITESMFTIALDAGNKNYKRAGELTLLSDDGGTIFYPDYIGQDAETVSLYYRSLKPSVGDAVKIASAVSEFYVDSVTAYVTYLDGNGNLYRYEIASDKTVLLATNVTWFEICDGDDVLLYRTFCDGIGTKYRKIGDAESVLIGGEVMAVSNNGRYICYTDENNALYMLDDQNTVNRLAFESVLQVFKVYDTGECYFSAVIEDDRTYFPKDYFVDDKPGEGAYDEIRSDLESAEYHYFGLFYYNGDSVTMVTDSFLSCVCADDRLVIAYKSLECMTQKAKLSVLEEQYDYYPTIHGVLERVGSLHVAVEDQSELIEKNPTSNIRLSGAGNAVYYVSLDEIYYGSPAIVYDGYGKLYCTEITEDVIGVPKLCDLDVWSSERNGFLGDGTYLYCKSYESAIVDLYIGGELIDSGVYCRVTGASFLLATHSDSDRFAYFAEYSVSEGVGVLKCFYDGKTFLVADNVNENGVKYLSDGELLYFIADAENHDIGSIYVFDAGERKLIEQDVDELIISDNEYYRFVFFQWQ